MKNQTATISRKLDALAIDQLRAEVVRLFEENEQLRHQLNYAEECAESWREDALNMQLQLCESTGGAPGITQKGTLVIVSGGTQ